MANPWRFTWVQAGIAWCLAVLGWFLVPSIIKFLSGLFFDLSFDAPRKLRELESSTVPILKDLLTDVEKQRTMRSIGEGSQADLMMLYKFTTDLRSALEEAEDILDLIDYHRIAERVTEAEAPGLDDAKSSAELCFCGACGSWVTLSANQVVPCYQFPTHPPFPRYKATVAGPGLSSTSATVANPYSTGQPMQLPLLVFAWAGHLKLLA